MPMASDRLDLALERLDRLINWERRARGGMDRDLNPVKDVLSRVGTPQEAFPAILVAGTKGKGSVSALIAAALQRAGLRVGVYASPHVERVTERVMIDGAEVPRDELGQALEEVLGAQEGAVGDGSPGKSATWFDLMTAAAFVVFAKKEVHWAVVEVGIGGRLDSTRSLEAPFSVVTNVALEHTAVLGDTRAAIAAEKGAVISQGGSLITGIQPDDTEPWEVLEVLVSAAEGQLICAPQQGSIDQRNQSIAEVVLNVMGQNGVLSAQKEPIWRTHLDADAVRAARLPGRQERFRIGGVPVVLDCGHTLESAEMLLKELERDPELGRKPKLLVALGIEKDAVRLLKAFEGHVDRCLCTTAPEGRLLDCEDLAELAHQAGHDPEAWEDPTEALQDAIEDASHAGGWVLIFGSFYLAAVLRTLLDRGQAADLLD